MSGSSGSKARRSPVVVVDMQPGYRASVRAGVQEGVVRLLNRARARARPVLLLELDPHIQNPTLPAVRAAAGDAEVVEKNQDDGSDEVLTWLERHGHPRRVTICGVNTDYCVQATAHGLAKNGVRVTVAPSACGSFMEDDHEGALERLKATHPNIRMPAVARRRP